MSNKTNEMTLESLAKEAGSYFTKGDRIGDTGELIRILKDDTPEWVRDLVQAAHGDMLPDDYRYSWVEDALSAIESEGEDATLEPDIYTVDLTRWLHSRADRYAYCDDAVNQGLIEGGGMITRMQAGQAYEQAEVVASVIDSLNKRLSEVESEQDDEEDGSED